ncbi:TPA: hypothetical protein DDW69_04225 [candidate division CPR2 bacterium]|uniref:GCN5-related N-acetyltransferase n=1 Tax=candidate division CPR2 bacterium GW2011_GWC1_41_48 TaxID=1618344 RepID=A0A0G0WB09_UNCC2|nr:MAG: GCN5-related N-acetyltransferase [candidate division CPR2 bacterium GW2011_GWC2_39_35]KKR28034.1 MAG: GCN5-related N-acetyltransferase [candidate division CPR2 bacterium GW2011_GWD2_39_7]KKR28154.1 MAG: GCN5-related N-acetyltransferase [candidate division CPR2 bacterium GW2011_GWD1_39_7]KKS09257.1 MAG: GCN5-related N-acetyltransferase [candidate division CPR2 bacterium GW2011_GWC1_41_48]OGB60303.1 MAG: hypothetical protein A2Y27_00430 [candidate division CPR2 bacterium GWD1_39_7]OGB721
MITFKETNDLNKDQLYNLFNLVGWIKSPDNKPATMEIVDSIANDTLFIDAEDKDDVLYDSFKNSTYVLSAWDNNKLIGIARVLTDKTTRSVIYDLAVLPTYQRQGIGKKLVEKCLEKFPKTQFTLGTSSKNFPFYEKFGFEKSANYLEKKSLFF